MEGCIMNSYKMENIRNVAVVGHGKCGKSSIIEAMLFNSGAINRIGKNSEGTLTSDFDIEETKRLTGCKNIICIMSGSMVQRGECAIFNKWQRAKAAIDAGADLVIELPAYYVLQSADVFAYGGVKLLDSLKIVDGFSFGCECGDTALLKKAADVMTDAQSGYDQALKHEMQKGLAYPKACENALLACNIENATELSKPNNTLGICYLKAIKQINSKLIPFCVKRNNDYHSDNTNDSYMSATERFC